MERHLISSGRLRSLGGCQHHRVTSRCKSPASFMFISQKGREGGAQVFYVREHGQFTCEPCENAVLGGDRARRPSNVLCSRRRGAAAVGPARRRRSSKPTPENRGAQREGGRHQSVLAANVCSKAASVGDAAISHACCFAPAVSQGPQEDGRGAQLRRHPPQECDRRRRRRRRQCGVRDAGALRCGQAHHLRLR